MFSRTNNRLWTHRTVRGRMEGSGMSGEPRSGWRHWLAEPLLWFTLAGCALFAAEAAWPSSEGTPDAITLSESHVRALVRRLESQTGRALTPSEAQTAVQRWVDEEVLSRHGISLGLDDGDPIVRRRVVQMVQLTAEADVLAPTDAELREHLAKHAERYRVEASWRLTYRLYGRQDAGHAAAERARRSGDVDTEARALPFSPDLGWRNAAEVTDLFGDSALATLSSDDCTRWCGPIETRRGWVLLRTDGHEPAHTPPFAAVRDALHQSWMHQARIDARQARLEELRAQVDVSIAWPTELDQATLAGAP